MWAGIVLGFYFLGVFVYLFTNAVVPLTQTGGWRGPADVIAVWLLPAGCSAAVCHGVDGPGVIGKHRTEHSRLWLHATFVAVFLVVAHVAMIFGMLNPTLFGYQAMVM